MRLKYGEARDSAGSNRLSWAEGGLEVGLLGGYHYGPMQMVMFWA